MKTFFFYSLLLVSYVVTAQVQIGSDINGETDFDEFGTSVSLSSNGNFLAIGSPYHGGTGYVRIYENQSGTWTQIGSDIDGESSGDQFGISVSLSSDGSFLAVGADANDGASGNNNGSVRVFENQSGTWTQIGADIDGEAEGDGSGFRVALSDDGSIVAITAKANDGNGNLSGHVRVYENQSGTWTQIGQDIDGENAGDEYGESLDISSDGSIIAVGSVRNGNFAGHVQVFQYNGVDTWTQIGSDIDGASFSEQSGTSLGLSANGSFVAIGAPNLPNFSRGNVRIFENQSGTWTQIGTDIIGDNFDNLGTSVDISGDGSVVAIGAIGGAGKAVLYQNLSGTWTQIGSTINGDTSGDLFGGKVSLSADSNILAVGARRDDNSGTNTGTVRAFDLNAIVLSNADFKSFVNLEIIPNPVNDKVSIIMQNNAQLKRVSLYDNLGKFIKSSNIPSLDVSELSNGLYLIEVDTSIGKTTEKLIIK